MNVDLGSLRLPEVEPAVDGPGRVCVPLGSTEQHGAHASYCTFKRFPSRDDETPVARLQR
jgi:hypothetical protein